MFHGESQSSGDGPRPPSGAGPWGYAQMAALLLRSLDGLQNAQEEADLNLRLAAEAPLRRSLLKLPRQETLLRSAATHARISMSAAFSAHRRARRGGERRYGPW
ncbi:MAG: hypothetical protein HY716_14895 [Planctomycetes bacterium]|nr:hypothetical protein [Planctomycetota bacterium]